MGTRMKKILLDTIFRLAWMDEAYLHLPRGQRYAFASRFFEQLNCSTIRPDLVKTGIISNGRESTHGRYMYSGWEMGRQVADVKVHG